jgi:ribosomal protein L2
MFFANGAITQVLTTTKHRIFSLFLLTHSKDVKKFLPRTYFQFIGKISKLSFVSVLSIKNSLYAQYSRSNGAVSRIFSFDKPGKVALIHLPSKAAKIFSLYTLVSHGNLMGYENKKYFNTKSGYWRSFGIKSLTRGVAKNPVDHPHGGRTKAISSQRTP